MTDISTITLPTGISVDPKDLWVREQIGSGLLNTTNKTIIPAINELNNSLNNKTITVRSLMSIGMLEFPVNVWTGFEFGLVDYDAPLYMLSFFQYGNTVCSTLVKRYDMLGTENRRPFLQPFIIINNNGTITNATRIDAYISTGTHPALNLFNAYDRYRDSAYSIQLFGIS